MSGDATAAEASPGRLYPLVHPLALTPVLLPAAVGDLAHDLRAAIHVVRGHAELLQGEATGAEVRESAQYILDASIRLSGLCEDVVDFLRLPAVAPDELVSLAFGDLGHQLADVASVRGARLRIVGPVDDGTNVMVRSTVRRVVSHILEQAVRMAASDVTIAAAMPTSRESCVIEVSPAPRGVVDGEDGIVAVAAEVLAARGGHLEVGDHRMDVLFPVVGERS